MTPSHTYPLDAADRVAGCGDKAARLAQLGRLKLRVPPGFVVADSALQRFLDENQLRPRAERIRHLLANDTLESATNAADELRQRVTTGALPTSVEAGLRAALAELGTRRNVIVRSSALGEDGNACSFAGQLDSILDVDPGRSLGPALRSCWASYWSSRALAYQRSRGIRLHGMGVIVQEQIEPRFAGVLFTANPGLGGAAPDDMVVEFCPGHGEALVQGRVDPGRVVIARSDWHVREQTGPAGPTVAQLVALARAGLAIEAAYGRPQDIEWALDAEDRLWLVQTRPITATAPERVLWSNANINENYPEPIAPLLYSIAREAYYHYFRNLGSTFGLAPSRLAAVEQPLRHLIGVHGGRMYYHLTHIHAVLQAAPFGARLSQYFSAFTGAETSQGVPALRGMARLRDVWDVTAVCRALRAFRTLPQRVAAFEQRVDNFAERTEPARLGTAAPAELLAHFREFLDIRFQGWTGAGLADAAAMISYGLLAHLLRREFPAADESALHNTLLKGLTDVVSGQPQIELWELSRQLRADPDAARCFARLDNDTLLADPAPAELVAFRAALAEYLHRWGYRRSGELMLTVPDFQEEPGPLLDILRTYVQLDGAGPVDRLQRQQEERLTETKRVLSILSRRRSWRWLPWPSMAALVRPLLRWCQRAIGLRERARMRQALLYGRCRALVLALGRQLKARGDCERAEDLFFLTYQELDELLAGAAMFPHHVPELVRMRRRQHAEVGAYRPPDRFTLAPGAYLPAAPAGATERSEGTASPELRGVGACGGLAHGPALVLADVRECSRLRPGDILVTRQTDPGWGLAFPLIRGLVLERGGMLSHGAILAREYGIPTVVGVPDAVRRIESGRSVQVDGDRGVVRILDR